MHICNVQSVDFSQRGPSRKIRKFKSWVGFKCPGSGGDQWSVAGRPKNVQMWTVVILNGLPRDTAC